MRQGVAGALWILGWAIPGWECRTSNSPQSVRRLFLTNGFQHFPKPFSENLFDTQDCPQTIFEKKFLWKQGMNSKLARSMSFC